MTAWYDDHFIASADLPDSWEVCELGEIIEDIRPGFSSGQHNEEGFGIPHLRPMNITRRGTITLEHLKFVTPTSSLRVNTGDILFNNTNSAEHIGKSAVMNLDGDWAYSNHLTRLRIPDNLIPDYVALQLLLLWRTGYFRLHARRHVNQVSIGVRQLRAIPLIVPPLEDQQHTIENVKSRYLTLDDVETAINDAMTLLTTYEHQTIAAAATGALIHGDPGFTSPWQTTTVANAGEIQLGKMRSPKSHSGPNMRPYLRVANVLENKIDTSDVYEMNFTPTEFEKYKLISGDVLLNEGQSPDLVGRPAMFRGEIDNCCFQKTLIRFRTKDGVSPTFALLVFRHYLHSGRFREAARWSTNIAHLTAIRFAAIEFPRASLEEQEAIVGEATRRLDLMEHLAETLDDILGRTSHARDIVLAEAFHVQPSIEVTGSEAAAQLDTSSDHMPQEERPMPTHGPGGRRGAPRPLLDVLNEEEGGLEVTTLFSHAGFTKELVDDFYHELRDIVRAGRAAEIRLLDGTIAVRSVGEDR